MPFQAMNMYLLISILKEGKRKNMKEVFIERQQSLLRIAIRQNNKLKECFFEDDMSGPSAGEIYAGVIKNIVPAIKCAFVDIGYECNCYMYLDNKFRNMNIKKGDMIPVQIVKEKSENKGPKVTSAIDISGRYCAVMTFNNDINISKKIKDEGYKKLCMENIKKPQDVGVMVRTNATKVDINEINKEIEKLYNMLIEIRQKCERTVKPGFLSDNGGILAKLLRDKVDENVSKIYADDEKDYDYINKFIEENADINSEAILYKKERTLFNSFGIEKEILSLRNNKVVLRCGGYIIINKTEAMYVIDVNSGKNVKNASIRKTALNTNIDAAEEIGRQIILRNLSGIIVIDFIDMTCYEDKKAVFEKLTESFKDDKNKTTIYPFTELNLVQIARKKTGRCINEYIEKKCPYCMGTGKRLKFDYIKGLIRNEIAGISYENSIKNIHIEISDSYKDDVLGDVIGFVNSIGASDKNIYLTYVHKYDFFNVEPLIFANQIRNMTNYKIYGK